MILVAIAVFWTGLVALAHFFPAAPFLSTIWSGERSFADVLRREGRKTLIPAPQGQDDRVGFVNYWTDLDGVIRRARFHVSDRQLAGEAEFAGEEIFSSMVARALVKLGRPDSVPDDVNLHAIRFGSEDAYHPLPLYEVFLPATWHSNYYDGKFFKDIVIIVGMSE